MTTGPSQPRLRDYAIAALLLAGISDTLFFDNLGRPLGLTAPLFAALLASAILVCNRRFLSRSLATPVLLLLLGFASLLEAINLRSLGLTAACLALFSMAAAGRLPAFSQAPAALIRFFLALPLSLPRDNRRRVLAQRRAKQRASAQHMSVQVWLVWLMPLVFAAGFALLLAAGNPILERWLSLIDLSWIVGFLVPGRIGFWLLAAMLTWPFLRPRQRRSVGARKVSALVETISQRDAPLPSHSPLWSQHVYGRAAILRALLLFNAVFAVQTLLDASYLWGGIELPDGISCAAYAHRGAYMLVVTALLAAAFVLVALRPGAEAAGDRRIRGLVFLWIGQNVVLVLSAMLRLELYVDVYALTHWRLAAFVWMGVVAVGLLLICVRIAGGRSNRWLVGANLCVLAIVVAGSCFVDDRALVAGFNVTHSRELSGEGVRLDADHLVSLGPAAIPAMDRYLLHVAIRSYTAMALSDARRSLAEEHRLSMRDWRTWTFRNWRLSRYLETHAPASVPLASMGPFFPPVAGSN
ncbi:DUF4173 domain-containing protein [uncultured Aureimonas sp.]|uniref:DUF4153 domain-containing protein n=1 Tax=uncultured Aureimonas sp. TaxID=1604662 RepID=UPI0025EBAFEF|nr:DUF4173 domain-containing protein [uncultured Aureimonas sp.]